MTIIQNRGAFLRRLTAGGSFTEAQAEVLADAIDGELGQPATKADLADLRGEMKADFAEIRGELAALRAELKGDTATLREELKGDTATLREELKGDTVALRNELKGETGTLRNELKGDIAALRNELKGDISTLGERMERVADRTFIRTCFAMAGLFGLAIALLRFTGTTP